jgi:GTP diphosphokinase / guanosine-3',5'-bis(diphosphate) 3'-diphosphatase
MPFSLLEQAIRIATDAHAGQLDKCRQPYILHPLRVMLNVTTDEERILATLHDVVEDTSVTLADLADQFPASILNALDSITQRPDEPHVAYLARVLTNPLATRVKIADIEDNVSHVRIQQWSLLEPTRAQRYQITRLRSLKALQQRDLSMLA